MIKNSVRRNPAKNTSSSSSMAKTESGPSSNLPPPPPISLPAVVEMVGSSWDLIKSFAPAEDEEQEQEQEQEDVEVVDEEDMRARSVGSGWEVVMSKSGSSWDVVTSAASYSSASLRDTVFVSSPERGSNTRPRTIKSWTKGQVLGIGSFGTVYEAISDNDGCFFAVKEVSLLDHGNHDDAQLCILQLEHEIALLSQFEHDNIVQYYGTDKQEDKLFIFLELVTQGSLASLYQKYSLRDPQVSAYTRQILEGLNYVHDRNIVHRDVKCANILVHADGSVKLADFGLAKEMSKINMLKSCKGSVYWMAPEVVNPRKTYGPAADIWSLGCTVLEMLTRQIPHPNVEWQHAFFKIGRGEQPPIPNNLSSDARDFITQCVQVDPDDRPSASQLLYHPFVRNHLSLFFRIGH